MRTAIRKHWIDFVAIIGLIVISGAVSIYILDHQRLTLPAWVPFVGKDFFVVKAELSTAQAVTPGQGQTVNVAGVQVGEISSVELKDGKALLTLRMEPKYGRVYKDATVLMRPKTGLKDMVAELEPGTPKAGRMEDDDVIPVSETLPDVNLDEILASLDADTRDYLTILVGAGAEGLRDNGPELARAIRRFEPTAHYGSKVFGALEKRKRNIKRVIHNLSLIMEELGAKDDQVAEFVENSNAVFTTLARQDANLRSTLTELPSALDETQRGLGKAKLLADELGPTLQELRPAARALAPTLRALRPFVRETTPIIRDEIRPFVRASRPTVKELRPAMRDLAAATPDLRRTFSVVNYLLDELAYNPPGVEEGYLFWVAWANHLGNQIFTTQDAHGPIRRGQFITTCQDVPVLNQVSQANPLLGTLTDLLAIPKQNCPTTSQDPLGGG
ncbi:MAG TPA: MlaD family protein [Solirubrobacteraceae bacterium]|nr:MlaD family protein [Solirubrobacteraceae bacterium]